MLTEEQETLMLQMEALEADCYIDPNEKIEYPPVAISYKEHSYNTRDGLKTYPTPIGTYGNFSFIQAPPKHQKTFLVSLLSAAYLGGGNDKFTGKLKGHRNGKCLFHFDTEQGRFHAQRVFRRPIEMSKVDLECYRTYGLRSQSPKQRLAFIDYMITYADNLGVVIIDGIADLIGDVNNIDEANMVVQKLMYWTEKFNIHIITVIHSNWGSTKPTGHLGSALEKKAETQIQLERLEADPSVVIAKCKASRGKSFENFSFFVNSVSLPEVADQDIEIIDLIGGSKIKHTNKASTAPVGKSDQIRAHLSA
jgi:hypothetical protein